MTREEAIRCLSVHSSTNGSGLCTDKQHYEAKQMAIKALEQEPILDKIRAEIEQITDTMGVSYNQYVSKIDVLEIIDKYRESEDKE